jgi:hypothetical protein
MAEDCICMTDENLQNGTFWENEELKLDEQVQKAV